MKKKQKIEERSIEIKMHFEGSFIYNKKRLLGIMEDLLWILTFCSQKKEKVSDLCL